MITESHANFALGEQQLAVQELVRRVAREKVAQRAQEIDARAEYPQDMFDLLNDLGLFLLPFPEAYGGANDLLSGCIAIEELGRVCYNTAYLLFLQWLPIGALIEGGTQEQKDRYLPDLAAGRLRGAFSLTESQSGSDVSGMKTTAVREGSSYRINGAKIWCTNAQIADFILVAAKVQGPEKSGINFFIVPTDTPGFQVGKKEEKTGARGVPSNPLFLENVVVGEEQRIGPDGEGFHLVMGALNSSRPIVAARGVGLAQGAIDHSIDFITNRRAFGRNVSDFQGIRWMVADMEIAVEASRQLTYRAASMVDAGVKGMELAKAAAIAKTFSSDTAMKVATDAVQLFGAAGISAEYPIARYFRDAKVLQIIEGTNQIQRNLISRMLLGKEGAK